MAGQWPVMQSEFLTTRGRSLLASAISRFPPGPELEQLLQSLLQRERQHRLDEETARRDAQEA